MSASAKSSGTAPGSPLRGRYLVKNRVANTALRTIDAVLRAVTPRRLHERRPAPRRVLLAVGGHIGDAVLATAAIRMVRRALPGAEIGVLAASWAQPVFGTHPSVSRFHVVDHWKLDRRPVHRFAKWRRHRATASRAVREIRAAGYDAAVDLYPYFPNAAALLWRARVPVRIGYESGGLGPLFTHALPWNDPGGDWHTVDQHRGLLTCLPGVDASSLAERPRYDMSPIEGPVGADRYTGAVRYVVIHPGAGDARKIWPAEAWRRVATDLAASGIRMAFTGQGAAEGALIASIIEGVPGCTDLCGRLDWDAFRAVIAGAEVVAGADTVAAHLAGAAGVPVVVVGTGMSDTRHWRPLGDEVTVLQHAVACAPCHHGAGCAAMACIRHIPATAVTSAIVDMLERHRARDATNPVRAASLTSTAGDP